MTELKLKPLIADVFELLEEAADKQDQRLDMEETGRVLSVSEGTVLVDGLPNVEASELIYFSHNIMGMAYNLDPQLIGVILLDDSQQIGAGDEVRRSGRVLDVPVGDVLLGRVVDPLGRPLDGKGLVVASERYPIERPAPPIMHRAPVEVPLQTGIKTIDALIPIGRGQRELILGDRQTGKTAIALDTIINQKEKGVICIYCAIGKENSAIAKVIRDLEKYGALEYSIIVSAAGNSPPGIQFIAPYAATSIGEYFMEQGRDVLVVYDDLTWHARAYRELALLLRRPPGREAYPGDIFYIHARLLERATHLKEAYGGGSLTALPIIETEAQNIAAFIPTNLISITDGQIYLSPDLFQRDILPAIDVGISVSRVGGKAQLPYYQQLSKNLRLSYTQFQELEAFARFGARLDEETKQIIARGKRIREVIKQRQFSPLSVAAQLLQLMAATQGMLDEIPVEALSKAKEILEKHTDELGVIASKIEQGEALTEEERSQLMDIIQNAIAQIQHEEGNYAAD
jgi:F-type H+-transporting ATPase subunit alpha